MDGEIKPKNVVLVTIIGGPKSGKSALAHEAQKFLQEQEAVGDVRVFTTNDTGAFDKLVELAQQYGVEA